MVEGGVLVLRAFLSSNWSSALSFLSLPSPATLSQP